MPGTQQPLGKYILTDDRRAHLCWHPGEEQWGFLALQSPFCFSSRKAQEWGWGDLGSEYSVSLMFSAYLLPSLQASASQYHPTTLPPHYHGFPLLLDPFSMLTCIVFHLTLVICLKYQSLKLKK